MSEKTVRPFGFRDKLGYLFGDFGNDFTFLLSSSFLLKFYTDVMGVNAGIVGVVMMTARFVDAFTDVAMGRLCDMSRPRKSGKFKPWILRMCLPVAFSSFLIYQSSVAQYSLTVRVIWLTVTYILWGSFFYTSVNIPYGSMASAISPDADARQSLSTYRTMGGMLAGAIVTVIIPLVAYDTLTENGSEKVVLNGQRFTLVAGIFSVLAVICYILCYFLVTERVKSPVNAERQEKHSSVGMLKAAFKNRALISIIVASILMLLAQLTLQGMSGYIFPNFYKSAAAQSASTVVMMAGMIIAAAVAKPLTRKFGKAEISVVSNLLAGAISLILYFIRPENVWVYIAFQGISWIGLGIFSMVNWALITDVIDYSELKNGVREDGSVYALYSFARKLGQAAASGLTGALLSMIGYSQETAFDTQVVNGIYNISTLIPAAGFILLSLVLWFLYPLHKKQVEENIRKLKEKRNENL
ncbi:MAG: MFS transporter [Clostridia bacterium]|nr:MFS transporter [Clostridia bacterium]